MERRVTLANVARALAHAESELYTAYVILDGLGETKLARQLGQMQHKLDAAVRAFRAGDMESALDALMTWGFRHEDDAEPPGRKT